MLKRPLLLVFSLVVSLGWAQPPETSEGRAEALQAFLRTAAKQGSSESAYAQWQPRYQALLQSDFYAAFLCRNGREQVTPEQKKAFASLDDFRLGRIWRYPADVPLPGRGWPDLEGVRDAGDAAAEVGFVAQEPGGYATWWRQHGEVRYQLEMAQARSTVQRTEALGRWLLRMHRLGLAPSELLPLWKTKADTLARADFPAMFGALISVDRELGKSTEELLAMFPADQQAAMKKLAAVQVAEYNALWSGAKVDYPADVPARGHGWGDLSGHAAAAAPPTPASPPKPAVWQPKYRVPTFFQQNGEVVGVVLQVDPRKKKYLYLHRTWHDKVGPYFLTASESGNYSFDDSWVSEEQLSELTPTDQLYKACETCDGEGCVYQDVVYTRGGHWEQVSSVVKVYTPRHVTSSYTKKLPCPSCGNAGWIRILR